MRPSCGQIKRLTLGRDAPRRESSRDAEGLGGEESGYLITQVGRGGPEVRPRIVRLSKTYPQWNSCPRDTLGPPIPP
ncbi:hypothetical protein PoB_001757000 [Plakobranchus ocellatus]|uniref:Uncharacterized protein n=1 Tax=Plakobranchus ocellatus TaxID=259542 RepID=A0AAV3Z7G9_9GAST|nr:hypothetical protein PoB_001757000 [Plakobranchus ocellatus]